MIDLSHIRNFCIIAHIDHGKSTLADRLLELTGTIPARKMRSQFLDQMDLERERGITIKMQPVRMRYCASQTNADATRTNADKTLLYEDLTYKIRGAIFAVRKKVGLGHKEVIYQNALEEELKIAGIAYEREKKIGIFYNNKNIGVYQPDFIIEGKIIVELKALPYLAEKEQTQIWTYLKGSLYRLALLINFSSNDVYIKRIVYDVARDTGLRSSALGPRQSAEIEYIFNLIDTPGHIDFTYEVSRALLAVEGAILLVDATQGVQAQTIANLELAKRLNLAVIPVVNKIDLPNARIEETRTELIELLSCDSSDILFVSAKTGEGVGRVLEAIIRRIPAPRMIANSARTNAEISQRQSASSQRQSASFQALIFDSQYSTHKGVLAHVRVFSGSFSPRKSATLHLANKNIDFESTEVGMFLPNLSKTEQLCEGEIGYIATNIKNPEVVRVGDTIGSAGVIAIGTYREPKPMVWACIFPAVSNEFEKLRDAFLELKLNDPALSYETEWSALLRQSLRVGFLGMLHLEITIERLQREFGVAVLMAHPTIEYEVVDVHGAPYHIRDAGSFENIVDVQETREPWFLVSIISRIIDQGTIIELVKQREGKILEIKTLSGDRALLLVYMPLRKLIEHFFEDLKSATQGYGSLSYEFGEMRRIDLVILKVWVGGKIIPPFSRLLTKMEIMREARKTVDRLYEILPHQLFALKIQAGIGGRILASRTLPALSKHVTAKLYGGDRSRKMKLWKKQQKGKKRLQAHADVDIPQEVYLKMIGR